MARRGHLWVQRLRRVRQVLLSPVPPAGSISWRLLLPGQPKNMRLRFQWIWQPPPKWPRLLWAGLQLWRWLTWMAFNGWRASWHHHRAQSTQEGRRAGFMSALAWALGHGLHPAGVHRHGLWKTPRQVWDYVFENEIQSYHYWRNAQLGDGGETQQLLADKAAQAEAFTALGVPMVPTLALLADADMGRIRTLLSSHHHLFCKMRMGSRAEGAFEAGLEGSGITGKLLAGRRLKDAAQVESALVSLAGHGEVLVQPLLRNHASLAPLSSPGDAITLRYISSLVEGRIKGLCAYLEVPLDAGRAEGTIQYVILPVDPASGLIGSFPETSRLAASAARLHEQTWAKIGAGTCLPDWPVLVEASHCAHRHCKGIWAVAWDWVITPEGPLLLEGNSGWSAVVPQLLTGPLLARTD